MYCWYSEQKRLILHLSSALSHCFRFCRLMTTCVYGSLVRTTWSASLCCASTALPPSFLHLPSCSGQFTPSRACAADAQWASRVITVRWRSTCATQTPAWTEGCVSAEKEAILASAVKTTLVSVAHLHFYIVVQAEKLVTCHIKVNVTSYSSHHWKMFQMLCSLKSFIVK